MQEVVIVAARRSPIGNFGGAFQTLSAVELAQQVVVQTMQEINLDPKEVDEVILGNVLGAGLGQNIARQVALKAGLPSEVSAFTVNKVCGSGLKSVVLAAQSIMCEDNEIVIAGGTENMSQAPYLNLDTRWGKRLGNSQEIDSILKDGLTDAFHDIHMGITAENIASKYDISRQTQDIFSVGSQQKAEKAIKTNRFNEEIVPIEIPQRKGEIKVIKEDEYPRFGANVNSLAKLKPAFQKDGTVTAGNASGINDGAAILILMSKDKAKQLGLTPLATIKAYASAGIEPELMGMGPVKATQKALLKANLELKDIELVEANEAFAAQSLGVMTELGLKSEIVNVNGGAIALGHPIGASGGRILVTLLHEMMKQDLHLGLATLCIGGGQGLSLIVEC